MTNDSSDWEWFREHQDRAYRARLATPAEIVHLQEHNGLDTARLARGCFVYCLSRIKRQTIQLQTLFVVLEPQGDMDEADCIATWYAAEDVLAGQIRGWLRETCNQRQGRSSIRDLGVVVEAKNLPSRQVSKDGYHDPWRAREVRA
jgi:hypothetical protein